MAESNTSTETTSLAPSTRKVTVGTLAGALVAIGVAGFHVDQLAPGIESALGTVVAALIFFFVPEAYVRKIPTS